MSKKKKTRKENRKDSDAESTDSGVADNNSLKKATEENEEEDFPSYSGPGLPLDPYPEE